VKEIAAQFEIAGHFLDASPYGSGHIHDTYLLRFEGDPQPARYILQRINSHVFQDPISLMDNVSRICSHLRSRLEHENVSDLDRRCLRLLHSLDGQVYWLGPDGDHWRCFHFLERTQSPDQVETEDQAYETARVFGAFAAHLTDLEGPKLAITIPHFHDLALRYTALESAIRNDSHQRAKSIDGHLDAAARWHEKLLEAFRGNGAADLPIRIVHNDCKSNNALLDAETGEGLCAIDLDTVMDGTIVADFGELMRTSSCPFAEDATQLDAMTIDLDLVRGVARGYAAGIGASLTPAEWRALPLSGSLMAFENAVRFLTDHLSGDVYFRVDSEGQNLDRARAQLRRVELLDASRDSICEIIASAQVEFQSPR
jgi:aminoglycoside phosphotransferase (APT) family kinase protein